MGQLFGSVQHLPHPRRDGCHQLVSEPGVPLGLKLRQHLASDFDHDDPRFRSNDSHHRRYARFELRFGHGAFGVARGAGVQGDWHRSCRLMRRDRNRRPRQLDQRPHGHNVSPATVHRDPRDADVGARGGALADQRSARLSAWDVQGLGSGRRVRNSDAAPVRRRDPGRHLVHPQSHSARTLHLCDRR
jgi:hypothetical protein